MFLTSSQINLKIWSKLREIQKIFKKKSTEYLSKILPLKNRGASYCVERYSVDFFLKIFWFFHNLDQIIKFIRDDAYKI
jgi:hypothetical protein